MFFGEMTTFEGYGFFQFFFFHYLILRHKYVGTIFTIQHLLNAIGSLTFEPHKKVKLCELKVNSGN